MSESVCVYQGCREPAMVPGALCFWHNPEAPRDSPDLKQRFEAWVAAGNMLQGVSLRYAKLEGLVLKKVQRTEPIDMRGIDFYRANLRNAHLFAADLRGASLVKADLSGATLDQANLEDADLLASKLHEAQISQVYWGESVRQEKIAQALLAQSGWEKARGMFEEAKDVYRGLYRACEERGLNEQASIFYVKMQRMHRKGLRRFSWEWFLSGFVELTSGYGECPARVIGFALGMIFIWSFIYALLGVETVSGVLSWSSEMSIVANVKVWLNGLYLSIVTFTTLGYGDVVPVGWAKAFAGVQSFIGAFSIALFVVVFTKKALR